MKDINKIILKNVEASLAEIDIDGMVAEATSKAEVKRIIADQVRERIGRIFQEKTLTAFRKQERIIDAWADNELRALLIKLGVEG